jgi:hypothetical protein
MTNVVIGDILPYTQATATAGQTVFGTNWTANAASDVVVYYTPVNTAPNDFTQQLTTQQFNVAFIGGSQQVQVTLVTPAANNGDIVTITRQTPADYLNLYTNTNFTPSMLNNDFGILTLVDQQAQLVDQKIGPRYNYSATIIDVVDTILPILTANQTWAKNPNNTGIVGYTLPPVTSGIAPADATYILQTTNASLPNAQALSALAANSLLAWNNGTEEITATEILGTANQITVVNGNGNGTIGLSIPANPIMPGVAGMGIPEGTTAQRVIPSSNISLRYNTDVKDLEYWNGSTWIELSEQDLSGLPIVLEASNPDIPDGFVLTEGSGVTLTSSPGVLTISATGSGGTVTEVDTGTGLTGGPITSTGTISLSVPVTIAHGGTGVTSVTIAPTATAFAGWDANKNLSANNSILGYTTTATAAGTTTLTVASTYQQFFTGSTTQTVVMPLTSTLVLGQQYEIVNNSTGNLTINSSGGNNIITMTTNTVAYLTCISISATDATGWYYEFLNKVETTGSVTSVSTNNGLTGGPITTTGTIGLAPIATLTGLVNITGGSAVPIANTLTAWIDAAIGSTQGDILYRNASDWVVLAPGTSGYFLQTQGAAANPQWAAISSGHTYETVVQVFTAGTSTYTPTTGMVTCTVELQAGGAGGGGAQASSGNSGCGGGGGGGAYCRKNYTAAQIGASATVVVGASANGGSAGNNNGTDGNASTFTPAGAGAILTANGGTHGNGMSQTALSNSVAGGSGGSATDGDLNISGGNGQGGVVVSGSAGVCAGGGGGGSFMAPAQNARLTGSESDGGNNYGGGGTGGIANSGSSTAGAPGAPGFCIVTELVQT